MGMEERIKRERDGKGREEIRGEGELDFAINTFSLNFLILAISACHEYFYFELPIMKLPERIKIKFRN